MYPSKAKRFLGRQRTSMKASNGQVASGARLTY
uniref:Uncharacterized protein n=1 Tax=Nelumbo nucifera TaxID=4432 RepID=A0A822Z719_NELNU|nr:TPA_asm: hypothetical protein HUJ06_014733 [Nelumbo nucifera]